MATDIRNSKTNKINFFSSEWLGIFKFCSLKPYDLVMLDMKFEDHGCSAFRK